MVHALTKFSAIQGVPDRAGCDQHGGHGREGRGLREQRADGIKTGGHAGFTEAWHGLADPGTDAGVNGTRLENGQPARGCPGCDEPHMVNDGWVITGTLDLPTIQPSILVTGVMGWDDPRPSVCHSYVTAGRIQFLQDCTHALKGQLVDLPEWPYS